MNALSLPPEGALNLSNEPLIPGGSRWDQKPARCRRRTRRDLNRLHVPGESTPEE